MSESDSADDDVQINFIASSTQKERWEDHADEAGFRSLSEFLRVVAEREAQGNTAAHSDADVGGDEKMSEVLEGLSRIESRLHDLDDRVATVERQVREDPEIKKLANEVFEILPTKDEIIEFEHQTEDAGVTPPDTPASNAGTVDRIANALNEEEHRIQRALEKLQQDTHQVHTMIPAQEVRESKRFVDNPSETRYYKKE